MTARYRYVSIVHYACSEQAANVEDDLANTRVLPIFVGVEERAEAFDACQRKDYGKANWYPEQYGKQGCHCKVFGIKVGDDGSEEREEDGGLGCLGDDVAVA